MKNILTINLENDMDLILAHKKAMKLAELCGMSLSVQTIIATAVSEIARVAIEMSGQSRLMLGILTLRGNKKQVQAVISDEKPFCTIDSASISYARRLADEVVIEQENGGMQVILRHSIPLAGTLSEARVQSFVEYFKTEAPLSPYDELRRKNTQLEELARRLRESENNYSLLTDSLPLMMFSIERSGKVIFTNKWLRDFLGFHVTHFNAVQCQPFLHPDDYNDLYKHWNNSRDASSPVHGQVRLMNVDSGQFIWHLLSIIPLKTEMGAIVQWTGFLVDIHAQKQIEQTLKDNSELKAARQQLEQYQIDLEHKILALNRSNDDLEQFASIASHDLQEPLRKIRTFVDIIARDLDNKASLDLYFGKIGNEAAHMSSLVKGVLDYSRLSDMEPAFDAVDLNKVIQQLENDFEALIRKKEATVQVSYLPEVTGQPLQMQQLFSNLMSNALKFTGDKTLITISASYPGSEEIAALPGLKPQQQYVLITFGDNGIGFEQKYSEKIFTIFQRLNGRETYSGTGIGLALCKKIVERHQGYITASSTLGEGAMFKIYLPL